MLWQSNFVFIDTENYGESMRIFEFTDIVRFLNYYIKHYVANMTKEARVRMESMLHRKAEEICPRFEDMCLCCLLSNNGVSVYEFDTRAEQGTGRQIHGVANIIFGQDSWIRARYLK